MLTECLKGIYKNKLRKNSCGDKAYQVFEQYKDNMARFQRSFDRRWKVDEQLDMDNGVTERVMMKPSTAVRNTKRKIRSSRRDTFKLTNNLTGYFL